MTGKTHLAGGALTGVVLASIALEQGLPPHTAGPVSLIYTPGILLAAVIGSVFPDVDWHTSKIGSAIKPISKVINMIFGHRTLFHAPIFYIFIYIVLTQECPSIYMLNFPFVMGAASHLILDMLNKKGISIFYPHPHRYHILSVDSNSLTEKIIRYILVALTVLSFFFGVSVVIKNNVLLGLLSNIIEEH